MTLTREVPSLASWSDPESQEAFRLVASGLCELAGFGLTLVYVRRGDRLKIVALAGTDRLTTTEGETWTAEQVLAEDASIEEILAHLPLGEDWGLFKFIHHDLLDQTPPVDVAWVPQIETTDDPSAWHPYDMLIAPIYDADGEVRGALGVDDPLSGRMPDAAQKGILESYARHARHAILTALQREALEEKARLADSARAVVRSAAGHDRVVDVLSEVGDEIMRGFDLVGIRARVVIPGDEHLEYAERGRTSLRDDAMDSQVALASRIMWERNEVSVIAVEDDALGVFGEDLTPFRDRLRRNELGSVALVPIGIGSTCLGSLALFRALEAPAWTGVETKAAMDLGRDLTIAMATQRALRREQATVRELQQLDEYKDRLIATVAHELKTPLTAILGQAEMLQDEELTPEVQHPVDVVERSARRMVRVINDLLMLASDGRRGQGNDLVDLSQGVTDATEMLEQTAHLKQISMILKAPAEPVVVVVDRTEMDRIVLNLVSNAIKYSPAGSSIEVVVDRNQAGAVLAVTDHGIGIAEHDKAKLFTEFFRSNDPAVRSQPGTGLGLAITARIVRRYGGRIEVDSVVGEGSTFRVILPTLAD
ncbi:MAG: sensor histidine kinase [Nocardioides sp.]